MEQKVVAAFEKHGRRSRCARRYVFYLSRSLQADLVKKSVYTMALTPFPWLEPYVSAVVFYRHAKAKA